MQFTSTYEEYAESVRRCQLSSRKSINRDDSKSLSATKHNLTTIPTTTYNYFNRVEQGDYFSN